MKPKSMHLLVEKDEEQWKNKKNIVTKPAAYGITYLVGVYTILIIIKVKYKPFLRVTLYQVPHNLSVCTLILSLFFLMIKINSRKYHFLSFMYHYNGICIDIIRSAT